MLTFSLPRTEPFAVDALLATLDAHAIPGLETVDVQERQVRRAGLAIDLAMPARVGVRSWGGTDIDTETVTRWLDLNADPGRAAALEADPLLADLVARWPGLRILGSVDPFETLVATIIGQQISLAATRTLAGRLVAAFGEKLEEFYRFPTAARLAEVGVEQIAAALGSTQRRAETVHAAAVAVAGGLTLTNGEGLNPNQKKALLAIPGIGQWTVDYLSIRLGDRDVLPIGDLVLQRALGASDVNQIAARGQAWAPQRTLATMYLWTPTYVG